MPKACIGNPSADAAVERLSKLTRRSKEIGSLIAEYSAEKAAERAFVTASAAGTPYDELATGSLTRTLLSAAPTLSLDWTADEGSPGTKFGLEAGGAFALYHPIGIAVTLQGGATAADGEKVGGFAEEHVAYVSRALGYPGTGGPTRVATAAAIAVEEKAPRAEKAADTTKPPATATATTEATDASGGGGGGEEPAGDDDPSAEEPNRMYVVVEASARQDFGAATDLTFALLAGVRPTREGAGVLFGVTVPPGLDAVSDLVPTLAISGEIPNLARR